MNKGSKYMKRKRKAAGKSNCLIKNYVAILVIITITLWPSVLGNSQDDIALNKVAGFDAAGQVMAPEAPTNQPELTQADTNTNHGEATTPAPTNPQSNAVVVTSQPFPTNKPNRANSIKISAIGDCTLGYDPQYGFSKSFPEVFEQQNGNYNYFFQNVVKYLANDDLTIANFEGTLTTANKPYAGKKFCFKGDPSYRNILLAGSVEAVSLANNHTMDYYQVGYDDTIANLNAAGIGHFGLGTALTKQIKGVTVGMLGYKNGTPNKSQLKKDIEALTSAGCKLIIVSFHWGVEYNYVPNTDQVSLGRAAIDYGADLVLGHHPHVIGSIEKYNDKYIVYSLGNFSFGGNKDPNDKDTFIFQQSFDVINGDVVDGGIEIIPCSVSSVSDRNNYQPTPLTGDDARRVINRLNDYSNGLKYGITLQN